MFSHRGIEHGASALLIGVVLGNGIERFHNLPFLRLGSARFAHPRQPGVTRAAVKPAHQGSVRRQEARPLARFAGEVSEKEFCGRNRSNAPPAVERD